MFNSPKALPYFIKPGDIKEIPLDLFDAINTLVNVEVLLLYVIFNLKIVDKLSQAKPSGIEKYLPDNKIGRVLKFFIARYIKL